LVHESEPIKGDDSLTLIRFQAIILM